MASGELLVAALGTAAATAALTETAKLMLARMNRPQLAAEVGKSKAEEQKLLAEAGQVVAQTMLTTIVEPMREDLAAARVDAAASRSDSAAARADTSAARAEAASALKDMEEVHRRIAHHEVWDVMMIGRALGWGDDDIPDPPPLWPDQGPGDRPRDSNGRR